MSCPLEEYMGETTVCDKVCLGVLWLQSVVEFPPSTLSLFLQLD